MKLAWKSSLLISNKRLNARLAENYAPYVTLAA